MKNKKKIDFLVQGREKFLCSPRMLSGGRDLIWVLKTRESGAPTRNCYFPHQHILMNNDKVRWYFILLMCFIYCLELHIKPTDALKEAFRISSNKELLTWIIVTWGERFASSFLYKLKSLWSAWPLCHSHICLF